MSLLRSGGLMVMVALTLFVTACGGAAATTPVVVVVTATPEAKPSPAASPTVAPTATVAAAAKPSDTIKPGDATPAAKPGDSSLKPGAEATKPAGSGATTAPKSGKTQVDALWFGRGPEGVGGGTSKVAVAVEKQTGPKELRVGFYESEVGGSGPMWRAAGWMAVISSGLLLGIDPSEYRYTYDVGGRIDGPSAGTLMTVATLATILGHTVKP
jgi:hypothetical protein